MPGFKEKDSTKRKPPPPPPERSLREELARAWKAIEVPLGRGAAARARSAQKRDMSRRQKQLDRVMREGGMRRDETDT